MNLQDDLIKSFTQAINTSGGEKSGEKTVYGIVARIEKDSDGHEHIKIKIDGSDLETPATSMVEVGVGDRVFATIKGHSVVVTGNISYPSLTRVGDVYITLTADGLVVGKLDDENNPVGYRILISPNNIKLIDDNGVAMSTYGQTVLLGKTGSYQVQVSSSGMVVVNPNGKVVASYGQNILLGDTTKSYLWITDTSVVNVSIGSWAVFTARATTAGSAVSDVSLAADLEGGGGIYVGSGSIGYWGAHFKNTQAQFGPSNRPLIIPVALSQPPTIGGTKIAMVGDYITFGSAEHTMDTSATDDKKTITFTPVIPSGYSLFCIRQIYISNDNWAPGASYFSSDGTQIIVRIHTVDGSKKNNPQSVSVSYALIRTS